MTCRCASGWVREEHSTEPWPHEGCGAAGMPCRSGDCPWWKGLKPRALDTRDWDTVNETTRPSFFRVVQPWGPDKARQATLISEHASAAEAFAEIDRLSAQMVRTGAPNDAVELLVVDLDGRIVPRPGLM